MDSDAQQLWPAILLLGPTGAGKSPLGDLLQARGWQGWRCHHFDFGAQLRKVAAAGRASLPDYLSAAEVTVIRNCLRTGALLETETFGIARKILATFAGDCMADDRDRLVLNGLPRHIGQARALAGVVEVDTVLELECDAGTVGERIRHNHGGDRTERTDDDYEAVIRRLETYRQRTLPLLEFYGATGAAVVPLPVKIRTTAADLWRTLSSAAEA